MVIYALGYTLICLSFFLTMMMFKDISFVPVGSHRVKEIKRISQINRSVHTKKETPDQDQGLLLKPKYEKWLEICDHPFGLTANSYLILHLTFTIIVGGGGATFFLLSPLFESVSSQSFIAMVLMILGTVVFLALMFVIPERLLKSYAEKQQRKEQKQFLHLLNYFQVFLRSGILPIDVIKAVILFIPNPLQKRLIQLFAEVQVLGRHEGFERFGNRLEFREANIFKNSIIDSMSIGSDASEVCRNLSTDMRTRRKYEMVKRIKKKPFFLLVPKMCFVVAILIIISIPLLVKLFSFTSY
jgi:pilus assembly protein TadC